MNNNDDKKKFDQAKLNERIEQWKKEMNQKDNEVQMDVSSIKTSNKQKPTRPSESIELNLRLPEQNEEHGITLKEIFTIFKRGAIKIFTVTLISVIVGIVAAIIYYAVTLEYVGMVTGIISFNYEGAEEGLDPHGRKLDISKIRSPQVLDKALNAMDFYEEGLTVEDIRQNITIEGIVPEDVIQRILIIKEIATRDPSKLDQLTDVSYISTQYAITLNIPRGFSFITKEKGIEFLAAIFRSYTEYFFEEYGDRDVLSTAVASLPYSEYDYDQSARVLGVQISNMINYLIVKRNEMPDFRANSTQMSFGDIITNIELLRTIDLANIRSLVEVRLVTKDRALLISNYQSLIVEKTLEKDVQIERARITLEAANNYQKDAAVMFGAAGTSDSTLQFTQPSNTYDTLIQQSATASESAIRLQSEIDYYIKRVEDLQNPLITSNRPADIMLVEESIESLSQKMALWIDIINDTVDEYMEAVKLKDSTKIVLHPLYTSTFMSSARMMAIIFIAVVFIGFMLSTISVFVKSIMKN